MIHDSYRKISRSRACDSTFDHEILARRKNESKLVRIAFNHSALPSIRALLRVVALRDQVNPSLRDVAIGGDELDLIRSGKQRQYAATRRRQAYCGSSFRKSEVLLIPEVEDVNRAFGI